MDQESLVNPSVINDETENLDSSSTANAKEKKQSVKPLKRTGFKCLGNIVKAISFLVALAIIAVHVLAAYILFNFRPLYAAVCFMIVTFGLVIALIVFFLIYALGHSINQNNEILYLLRKNDEK